MNKNLDQMPATQGAELLHVRAPLSPQNIGNLTEHTAKNPHKILETQIPRKDKTNMTYLSNLMLLLLPHRQK
jgi:hypothetical protein